MYVLSETDVNQLVSQNVIPSKSYLGGIAFRFYRTGSSYAVKYS